MLTNPDVENNSSRITISQDEFDSFQQNLYNQLVDALASSLFLMRFPKKTLNYRYQHTLIEFSLIVLVYGVLLVINFLFSLLFFEKLKASMHALFGFGVWMLGPLLPKSISAYLNEYKILLMVRCFLYTTGLWNVSIKETNPLVLALGETSLQIMSTGLCCIGIGGGLGYLFLDREGFRRIQEADPRWYFLEKAEELYARYIPIFLSNYWHNLLPVLEDNLTQNAEKRVKELYIQNQFFDQLSAFYQPKTTSISDCYEKSIAALDGNFQRALETHYGVIGSSSIAKKMEEKFIAFLKDNPEYSEWVNKLESLVMFDYALVPVIRTSTAVEINLTNNSDVGANLQDTVMNSLRQKKSIHQIEQEFSVSLSLTTNDMPDNLYDSTYYEQSIKEQGCVRHLTTQEIYVDSHFRIENQRLAFVCKQLRQSGSLFFEIAKDPSKKSVPQLNKIKTN